MSGSHAYKGFDYCHHLHCLFACLGEAAICQAFLRGKEPAILTCFAIFICLFLLQASLPASNALLCSLELEDNEISWFCMHIEYAQMK